MNCCIYGRQYYISAAGCDSNSGMTPDSAWQTLDRANKCFLNPGDSLLLDGDYTYDGTLLLEGLYGQPESPITICSYGKKRAVIYSGRGSALLIKGCRYIKVIDLDVKGAGRKTGNEKGSGIHIIASQNITVKDVGTYGFQYAGAFVDGSAHVRLDGVLAHDNGFAGILTGISEGINRNMDLFLCRCTAYNNPGDPTIEDNHSGNGILIGQTDGAVVEYCEAYGNGWDMQQVNWNGPVGIWTYDSDKVLIQYCISHHNRSTKGDGGGFDLDGGATNCILQFNLSYENNGCGYLLCQYPGGKPWYNNTVRFCVSVNDGQKDHKAGIFTYALDDFAKCDIYHCVIINSEERHCVYGAPPESRFMNNIFVVEGHGQAVVDASEGIFQANCNFSNGKVNIQID